MDALRNYWHPIARSSDVGDRPIRRMLLDEFLVLWRAGDRVVCLQDLCIHRGSALSLGWIEGETIVCGYHGWQYGPDGACLRIPSLPEGRSIPRKARAVAYRAQERYGLVWACLGEPRMDLPEYPAYDSETYATHLYEPYVWKANAARVIENVLDYTHFPWVHPGMLGDRAFPVYPEVKPRVSDTGLSYEIPDDRNATTRRYELTAPFSLNLTVTSRRPGGRNYSMLFTCAPNSATETTQWFFTSRDWSLHQPDLDWYKFDEVVMDQDQLIVENQRPELLPLDLTAELHLRGTDAGALEYRRLLRKLGVSWAH
jgi:phenylpropionate dioxygenase-like ring-hydroxylating dioxygenase large terminal subunit